MGNIHMLPSLPPRGAWIETGGAAWIISGYARSLPPRGAWIETCVSQPFGYDKNRSLPPRGAWIETWNSPATMRGASCRSPHGERGLKLGGTGAIKYLFRRSPHGERGLKPVAEGDVPEEIRSLPPRGAWIETVII